MGRLSEIWNNETHVCRQCLNRIYGTSLLPPDCRYSTYSMPCPGCGQMHQIPIVLTLKGRAKILFRKRSQAGR